MSTPKLLHNLLRQKQRSHDKRILFAGYEKLRSLGDSPQHIVPGHDPLVLERYETPNRELEGIAVRLDATPRK